MPARRLVGRKAAGLPGPKRPRALMVRREGIALHYSGTLADVHAEHSACAAVVRAWYDWHTRPGGLGVERGGADVAYNWAICPHGYRFVLRGRRYQSGANGTADANRRYWAVCVMGGDRPGRRDLTDEALEALRDLFAQIGREVPTATRALPHSHFTSTSCPGDELRSLVPRLQRLLRA